MYNFYISKFQKWKLLLHYSSKNGNCQDLFQKKCYIIKLRDKKVKEICSNANIPLLTFYINMPNEPNYIVNRINQYL